MTGEHPALDWLARRRAGESVALVAHRAGVPEAAVRRATRPYGPFPRANQHLGRSHLDPATITERTRRWVDARRRGVLVSDIAADEGTRHQFVSEATREHGPFPAPDVVEGWVQSRRQGRSLAAIAEAAGVRIGTVRVATRPYGPFPRIAPRTPDGIETLGSIARRLRLSKPTVGRWYSKGLLPKPDFTTARGRPVWLSSTIARWLEHDAPSGRCPECGAPCLVVAQHVAMVHRRGRDVPSTE